MRLETLTNDKERVKQMSMKKEKERKGLQTDGDGFLSAFARVAFTFRQAPFQLFRQAFVTLFTHRLQVHLHKSVPAGPPSGTMRDEIGETSEKEGKLDGKLGLKWERGREMECGSILRADERIEGDRSREYKS